MTLDSMKRATGRRVENVPYVPYVPRIGHEKGKNGQAGGYIGHIPRGRYGEKTMVFDVTDLLENLFGDGPTVALAAVVPVAAPEPAADPLAASPFADWVRRPDCHGRMGWELPGLTESDRWWARCDFDGLPEVPVGFSIGELPKPAQPRKPVPRIAHVAFLAAWSICKTFGDNRPLQGQLRGFDRV